MLRSNIKKRKARHEHVKLRLVLARVSARRTTAAATKATIWVIVVVATTGLIYLYITDGASIGKEGLRSTSIAGQEGTDRGPASVNAWLALARVTMATMMAVN